MKPGAPRNRTLSLQPQEAASLGRRLFTPQAWAKEKPHNATLHGEFAAAAPHIPQGFANLIFADPPYNLSKTFAQSRFSKQSLAAYQAWAGAWLQELRRILAEDGTLYVCCDWTSSPAIFAAAAPYFTPMNRITWEREKGRGAKRNWKNCHEDIWFFVKNAAYTFDATAVKMKRKVLAPYTLGGQPKDWEATPEGNFRYTAPSNLWTDITVPFWSMPENTCHPTQKPEKLLAKLILASSRPGELVFDPFLGSGSTSVVARKLGRRYLGCEKELEYCLLAEKRLLLAEDDPTIQGYADGVFYERNSAPPRYPQRKSG